MEVQIHYELAALTFMLAATLVFFRQRHLRVYRSSLFFWLMALGVVTAVCDVFCGITDLKQIPFTAGIVAHTLLFIASLVLFNSLFHVRHGAFAPAGLYP